MEGSVRTLNVGLGLCNTEYIAPLDGDDLMHDLAETRVSGGDAVVD